MASRSEVAFCMSMISFSGCVFLLLVGILIKVQPEYMKLSKAIASPLPVFETAGVYGALFVVISVFLYMDNRVDRMDPNRYRALASCPSEHQPLLSK
ncbi:unnamed protein product [Albugo candida]|uniref:Uncharacterized protein n=1 Tax=Albugo candida TaxID=65357 RepID=A0A024GV74_9STRA|nr:unnamed protein product [Albugo candida]|eukprot:CCI50279.1 unnamed protein product [Albugo candida]